MFQTYLKDITKTCYVISHTIKNFSITNYLINEIEKNIDKELNYKTNVKGQMTHWKHFVGNEILLNSISESFKIINFFEKSTCKLVDMWGNKLLNNAEIDPHDHKECSFSGILYLNNHGPGTTFPELNLTIEEEVGKIVFFTSTLIHFVKKCNLKKPRYTIAFNFYQEKFWKT